ncbi:MAG: hypothetical protein ABIA08_02070 [bacterium]
MFFGEYFFSGRRLAISHKFGLPIGTTVAIRKGPGRTLTLFPNPADQKGGCLITIGTGGRISIPFPLQRYAEIENGGTILGCYSFLEILSRERWKRKKEESECEREEALSALHIRRQQNGSG